MELELFVLCDAATDYRGRLNILGTFDTIHSRSFPAVWPHCALALRLRYTVMEEGKHPVSLAIRDQEKKEIVPAIKGEFGFKVPPGRFSAAANLVLNVDRLSFAAPGEYLIELSLDDEVLRRLPLNVVAVPASPEASEN